MVDAFAATSRACSATYCSLLQLANTIGDDQRHTDARVFYEGALDAKRYQRFEVSG